jgi:acetyltransferase-like isoleucine patch superfamily enzyme
MKKIFHYSYYPFNYLLLKLNKVKFGSFKIFGLLVVSNKGELTIGDNVRINTHRYANVIGGDTRTSMVVKKGAVMVIGNNVSISNAAFFCSSGITLEDHVMIGGSCKIWDSDFHPIDPVVRKNTPNLHYNTKPIHIKQSAFVGGNSIVLKGVTIGRNSVVAAGSVVVKDIPDNEIWGGNPARFIKKLETNE